LVQKKAIRDAKAAKLSHASNNVSQGWTHIKKKLNKLASLLPNV